MFPEKLIDGFLYVNTKLKACETNLRYTFIRTYICNKNGTLICITHILYTRTHIYQLFLGNLIWIELKLH